MDKLISNGVSLLAWAQKPSLILAALACLVAGYCWLAGGESGRRMAKNILIGVGVGLLLINGSYSLVSTFNTNITF